MIKRVTKKNYQVGMYIELDKSEMRHPFIRSEFILTDEYAVELLADHYDSVNVNFAKSKLAADEKKTTEAKAAQPVAQTTAVKAKPAKPATHATTTNLKSKAIAKKVSAVEASKTTAKRPAVARVSSGAKANVQKENSAVKTVVAAKVTPAPTSKSNPQSEIAKAVERADVYSCLSAAVNANMDPKDKAHYLFQQSTLLMEHLLSQQPTAEMIRSSETPLHELTDCILDDEQVALYLLRVISPNYSTYTQSANTAIKSLLIARKLIGNSDTKLLRELGVGFFLHDLGKAQLDPQILNHPGKLAEKDALAMREHPHRGTELLRSVGALTDTLKVIVEQHHERSDGTGYPFGLKGRTIHPYAQICALADTYNDLTAKRSYQDGLTVFDALKKMKNEMQGHFDPRLLGSFIQLFVQQSQR